MKHTFQRLLLSVCLVLPFSALAADLPRLGDANRISPLRAISVERLG